MQRRLYSLLLYLLLPLAVARACWRGWRSSANRVSLRAVLALEPVRREDRPLWLHAASVGELRAVQALLLALGTEAGAVLVTVGTPTGLARARELFAGNPHITAQAAPWDLPGAVRRFLNAARPRAAVFVEAELWPNLVAAARTRRVPLALVSARLSERSLARYLRWAPRLARELVQSFTAIGAQTDADRERFLRLGAHETAVTVVGNLKFDVPPAADLRERGAALRARWAAARPLWVAGSTHPGEEDSLLAAQRELLAAARAQGRAAPLLAMAPRRPERFDAVARALGAQSLRYARTTLTGEAEPDVLLVDEMGVLMAWYAAADVAFVGGSLVPVGGHNLLEPAALGRPLLTGPHVETAPEVARQLLEAGGARMVRSARELQAALELWFADAAAATEAGAAAAATVATHAGAAMRARALVTAAARPSAP